MAVTTPNIWFASYSKGYFGKSSVVEYGRPLETVDQVEAGDVYLSASEFWPDDTECFEQLRSRQVITMCLADGILEWRNSFEHPPSDLEGVGKPLWAPVMSDYFLAIGEAQKRSVEPFGNDGRCYVIGAPRLESSIERYKNSKWSLPDKRSRKVLIASAKRFAQGAVDGAAMVKAYADLKRFFHEPVGSLPVRWEPVWRVSEELAAELALSSEEKRSGAGELGKILGEVDAVICNQSTLILEAMLYRLPVASLDYTDAPHFIRTAWNIKGEEHIVSVMMSMCSPQQHHVRFQDIELRDQLQVEDSPSAKLDSFVAKVAEGNGATSHFPESSSRMESHLSREEAIISQLRYQIRREREASSQRIERLQKTAALVHQALGGREIFIWGAGVSGRKLREELNAAGIYLSGFVDSDHEKQGTVIEGLRVYNPESLARWKEEGRPLYVFIGSIGSAGPIRAHLQTMGLRPGVDYACS